MKERRIYLLVEVALSLVGVVLSFYFFRWKFIPVFLLMWGNNMMVYRKSREYYDG
jgi:hypothetical protein